MSRPGEEDRGTGGGTAAHPFSPPPDCLESKPPASSAPAPFLGGCKYGTSLHHEDASDTVLPTEVRLRPRTQCKKQGRFYLLAEPFRCPTIGEPLTEKRIGFPDFLDEFAPFGRWDAAGLVFRNVDRLHGLAGCLGRLGGALGTRPRGNWANCCWMIQEGLFALIGFPCSRNIFAFRLTPLLPRLGTVTVSRKMARNCAFTRRSL